MRTIKQQTKAENIKKLLQSDGVDSATIEKFIEWFFENQSTWINFKSFANKAMQKNKRLGAKCIAENVRYYCEIETNDEYKVNNSYVAYMARLYNANVKQEYFETRDVRGLREAA